MPVFLYPFIYLPWLLVVVLVVFYLERKLSAFIQDRMGPTHVGKWGTLQPFADLLKLIQKEMIIPAGADKILFFIAPMVIFISVFAGFALLPIADGLLPAESASAVLLLLVIISLDVAGILMAGWSGYSKYPVLGAMRSISQMVSYEVPLGLAVLCVISVTGTMNLNQIALMQQGGGFTHWLIIQNPVLIPVFLVFYITTLAESNRAPFDIPEGESELVGGFHTEYTGFYWALFFLSEYAMMIVLSGMAAIFFFGGWYSPLPDIGPLKLAAYTNGSAGSLSATLWGVFWISLKIIILCATHIWVRWTYPRLRVDSLTAFCWKYLTPASLMLLLVCAWLSI